MVPLTGRFRRHRSGRKEGSAQTRLWGQQKAQPVKAAPWYGLGEITCADKQPPARHRLDRATGRWTVQE